ILMKRTLIMYMEEHPFLVALVFISFMMLLFAPISASSGAYVDYNALAFDVVALWFIGSIAYFINRKW
ncbi:MAG: hypothetical protein U9O53_02500, partial [archaeon]|nr:hypothetical protein [archaeon]